jgi:hypothetical protein
MAETLAGSGGGGGLGEGRQQRIRLRNDDLHDGSEEDLVGAPRGQ